MSSCDLSAYVEKELLDTNHLTVAVDVESTGQHWDGKGSDVAFAIGWYLSDRVFGVKPPTRGQVAVNLHIGQKYLPLTAESMEQLWLDRGYEYDCYKYFWSKNVDVFRDLQDPEKIRIVSDERAMIQVYVDALESALRGGDDDNSDITDEKREKNEKKLIQVFDTVCFDSAVFNYLRSKLDGCASMMYTPDGKHYVRSYEVDSMLYGLLQIPIGLARTKSNVELKRKAKKWLLERYWDSDLRRLNDSGSVGVPHMPQYDALQILKLYLSIQAQLYYCNGDANMNASDELLALKDDDDDDNNDNE